MKLSFSPISVRDSRRIAMWARWGIPLVLLSLVVNFVTVDDSLELTAFLLTIAATGFIVSLMLGQRDLLRKIETMNTELTDAANRLRQSESEKTILLQEYIHRTRNDYQRLMATLMLQERSTKGSDDACEALATVRRRIEAMASLHARLSEMTSLDGVLSVDSRKFLDGMVYDLSDTIGARSITLLTKAESHLISRQQAISVGLIVNEAVTNAVKYAFPDHRSGTIEAIFKQDTDGFLLVVQDDGVGQSADASPQGSGLGSRIIRSLAKQTQGTACLGRSDTGGTAVKIRFPSSQIDATGQG